MPSIATLTVGPPQACGALTVFPVFGPTPTLDYRSFAEASGLGASIHELDGRASVNDLVVRNPLDVGVLLYEGEEVRGAQQDRTLDVSVLVAAGATVTVPVSCVEAGRWDGSRKDEAFAPAPTAAFPELRRAKNRASRLSAVGRAVQSEVWDLVADRADEHGAVAPTGAMRDVFDARRDAVEGLRAGITRQDGQVGAVAAIGERICVADVVGRSDVFAALFDPLVSGYALDAVDVVSKAAPPAVDAIDAFLQEALTAASARRPGVGLGELQNFAAAAAEGSRLVHEGELVAMTAFPGEQRGARVGRPSARRA